MHAAGNDYIYVSGEENRGADYPSLAKKLCDRRFGVGADGIIAVYRDNSVRADAESPVAQFFCERRVIRAPIFFAGNVNIIVSRGVHF